MEGDSVVVGGEDAVSGNFRRSADDAEGGDGERGRQPNPGRGHLPRKGKRRSKVRSMLEMSTPARTRIWKLSY